MPPLRDMNTLQSRPLVTHALIAANVALFLYQLMLASHAVAALHWQHGLVPYLLTERFRPASLLTPLTSMFLHRDLLHLISNMWFLALFGGNVEDALGRARFAIFYVLCGIAAAAAHVFVDPYSRLPMIGASGAISGVLGASYRLFPRARLIMRMWPAVVFIVIWFALQLLQASFALSGPAHRGIAVFAHIGGFVAGLMLIGRFGPRIQPAQHGLASAAQQRYPGYGYDRSEE